MNGIAVDTFEAFESLTEVQDIDDLALQIDADIFRCPAFAGKYAALYCDYLVIRNPVPARLNRLILDSSFKLQLDYLESLGREFENYGKSGVKKVLFDFDLPGIVQDDEKCGVLQKILSAVKGIAYAENIEVELLFRLPFSGMEDFTGEAAFFRQQSMTGLNYAVDLHIHEAGFASGDLEQLLRPVQYDIGTVNFVYDAALGNKINSANLKKMTDHMRAKGSSCNFFLCPSGNINFRLNEDLEQWIELVK